MRNAGHPAQAGIRLQGEISITSDMQMTPPLGQKVKRNWRASWWKWKRGEKPGLKVNIRKTKITASSLITWLQIDGETVDTVTGFIFLGSKIIADGDCSHEIKRRLLIGRKVMTNLDSILNIRDITLVHLVKAMVFPVVMYGCESCTIKKAEHRRTAAFELWCWRRLLRVPWTIRRSIQKESSLNIHWKDWCWSWNSNTSSTWCEELTPWKRPC